MRKERYRSSWWIEQQSRILIHHYNEADNLGKQLAKVIRQQ